MNRLLTIKEVAADWAATLDGLPAKAQAAFVYSMQTGMGGFPRDKAMEERIAAMPDDEPAMQAWLEKHGKAGA